MKTQFAFDAKRLDQAIQAGAGIEIFRRLALDHGVHFGRNPADLKFMTAAWQRSFAHDATAQSALVTVANSGVPNMFLTYVDPKIIPILVAPMRAAQIAGEAMKGDWTTEVEMFITGEQTGETSAYGDYSESGTSDFNVDYPQRQNFLFQSFLQYGEREVARASKGKVDLISQKQGSNALALMKALNAMYFFGVGGLQNYGLLNDPSLPPAMTAQFSWLSSASATANTQYQDIVRMYQYIAQQNQGVVRMDAPMVLAMSPEQEMALPNITLYNTNSVKALLKQNFPALRIETAPEYATSAGQLMQLFLEEFEGQRTTEANFSSKMMAHNMVVQSSSWKQKRSSGGYGTVIFRPTFFAQMYG